MILAVDVHYQNNSADCAGVAFETYADSSPSHTYLSHITSVQPYESGAFYKRELPCILSLLEEHALTPDIILIDGYVTLGEHQKPGLGQHLYHALHNLRPVIGIAKKPFKGVTEDAALLRGQSLQPLYISSVGVDLSTAKQHILSMSGKHRIPTLLKLADTLCRNARS